MICIVAVDIFAHIIAVDDAEIWFIAAAAVGDAFTFDTNRPACTLCSQVGCTFCAAKRIIGFGIDAFDGIGCRACTYIYITGITGILACAAGTRA